MENKPEIAYWDYDSDREFLRFEEIEEAIQSYIDENSCNPESLEEVKFYGFSREPVDRKSFLAHFRILYGVHG